jgi:hypothetical protein
VAAWKAAQKPRFGCASRDKRQGTVAFSLAENPVGLLTAQGMSPSQVCCRKTKSYGN